MSRLYVYAFLGEPLKKVRTAGHAVEVLRIGGVHVAVERLGQRPIASEKMLREQHTIVTNLAGRVDAIVPVRFGAFLECAELEHLITLRHDVLRRGLDRVRGKSQMTIRVIAPRGSTAPIPKRAASGTSYLLARRAANPAPPLFVKTVLQALGPLIVEEQIEVGTTGSVAATIFHLIARADVAAYRSRIAATAANLPSNVRLILTGPWPPFAFTPELVS